MFGRRRKQNEQQDEEYRHSEPETVVKAEGVVMSGPAGAPQKNLSPDERRERDRSTGS